MRPLHCFLFVPVMGLSARIHPQFLLLRLIMYLVGSHYPHHCHHCHHYFLHWTNHYHFHCRQMNHKTHCYHHYHYRSMLNHHHCYWLILAGVIEVVFCAKTRLWLRSIVLIMSVHRTTTVNIIPSFTCLTIINFFSKATIWLQILSWLIQIYVIFLR